VFLINLVPGTADLAAAFFLLPHDQSVSGERIDGLGSGLRGLTVISLIFGLIQGSTDGWTGAHRQPGRRSPRCCLVAGAARLRRDDCADQALMKASRSVLKVSL
jgi:hypothetical protein